MTWYHRLLVMAAYKEVALQRDRVIATAARRLRIPGPNRINRVLS